jgi:2-phosphosulfolactate phosphatase
MTIEATFTPAEFERLCHQDLSNAACVVFDVLRATSTIVTALAAGAESVLPVGTIDEAVRCRAADAKVLLAGERDGLRITAALSGGVNFDLGNSPREYTSGAVRGRRIVTTTTNGTRAFAACRGARHLRAASFLNMDCTAQHIAGLNPARVILVCAGTGEDEAFEDNLGAGALCRRLVAMDGRIELTGSARRAAELFTSHAGHLEAAMQNSSNARRLLSNPELRDDVAFCLTENLFPVVVGATMPPLPPSSDPSVALHIL